jgi:flagellar protein FliS
MLAVADPSDHYRRMQIETASPAKLLLMLYDAAVHRCETAVEGIRGGDVETAHNDLIRVQAILTELMAALDMDATGAPVRELYSLYEYMYRNLVQANIHKQVGPIEEVARMLAELRDAWEQAAVIASTDEESHGPRPVHRLDLET